MASGFLALVALFVCLLAPMYIFRSQFGIPLDAEGPDGEIWFLIGGGAVGAGLARFVHHLVFCSLGGYSEKQESKAWGRGK